MSTFVPHWIALSLIGEPKLITHPTALAGDLIGNIVFFFSLKGSFGMRVRVRVRRVHMSSLTQEEGAFTQNATLSSPLGSAHIWLGVV